MASCPFNSHNINNTSETLSSGSVHEEQTYILPPGPDISPDSLTHDWFIRPYEFISELASQYGDIFTLRFAHIGTQVIVSRPDHIKAIFNGSPDQLHAGKGNEILRVLMGSHSPMLLDGVQHLARRKTMLPAFHTSHISRLAEVMEQVTSDATSHWLDGELIVLQPTMLNISLRILLRSIFGIHNEPILRNLISLIQRFVTLAGTQSVLRDTSRSAGQNNKVRDLWEREVKTVSDALNRELYAHLDQRRQQKHTKGDGCDILDMLLAIVDQDGQPLSNDVLRDHLMTLFIAGHETSASSLSWAMHWLLRTPQIHDRLEAELVSTANHDGKYLEAVCHETLRMDPPISEISRKLQSPMRLDQYYLPAGISLCPSIYLTHHRPDTFPYPDDFRPERFLEKKYSPHEYLPFGGGVRRCIGMSLALLEMKVVLAHLIRNFRFQCVETGVTRPMRRAVLVTPSTGGRVRTWRKSKHSRILA